MIPHYPALSSMILHDPALKFINEILYFSLAPHDPPHALSYMILHNPALACMILHDKISCQENLIHMQADKGNRNYSHIQELNNGFPLQFRLRRIQKVKNI